MCTLVILWRPGHEWPLLTGANRDELVTRPSKPPGRHWPDRDHVVAGLDVEAGGSWLGINDDRVVAAVLNRRGTLGPEPGRRSRGELVLEALDHAEAGVAAEALHHIDPAAYRPFNLVVADPAQAFWLRHAGDGAVMAKPIAPGIHVLGAGEMDDASSPKIRRCLPRFASVPPPDPDAGDWLTWSGLLGDRRSGTGDPRDAINVVTEGPYGTCSSSLIALSSRPTKPPVWLFADGRPDEAPFLPVELVAT